VSTTKRTAAIELDQLMDTPLSKMSAADLIRVLNHRDLRADGLNVALADKKKVELWIDEGPIFDIPLEDLLERLRGEKKKIELEPPPWLDRIRWPDLQANYGQLAEAIADVVAARLSER
jgi:hypothetical protein